MFIEKKSFSKIILMALFIIVLYAFITTVIAENDDTSAKIIEAQRDMENYLNNNITSITIPANVGKVGSSNNEFIRRADGGKLEYIKFLGNPLITDSGRLYVKTFYANSGTTAQKYAERYGC